jgi:voltage-gated potassium channel
LRIWISPKRKQYIFSFFGLVDLMALVPSYLSLFFPGLHTLVTIRTLRLIRIFRILQLTQYSEAGAHILTALKASKAKIIVFISFVLSLAIVFGTVLYLVEGKENGFTSIPMGVYWSIVTMTTVGFGDLAPKTGLGQFISSILMIMGYGVIAVPTGVVGFELSKKKDQDKKCQYCGK